MKKFLALVSLLSLLAVPVLAEVDLSGMSYDELVALKDQLNLAMWNSKRWEEVVVSQGLWEIGKDIPAGHYTVKPLSGDICTVTYGDTINADSASVIYSDSIYRTESLCDASAASYKKGNLEFTDIDAKEGCYIMVDDGSAIFTPYIGKNVLSFINRNKKTTPTPAPAPVSDFDSSEYPPIDYKSLARNPEKYTDQKATITGRVVQVIGSRSKGYDLRVATDGKYDDIVYVYVPAKNTPDFNILEDDKIIAPSILKGDYTYETVLGSKITLPLAYADSVSLAE